MAADNAKQMLPGKEDLNTIETVQDYRYTETWERVTDQYPSCVIRTNSTEELY